MFYYATLNIIRLNTQVIFDVRLAFTGYEFFSFNGVFLRFYLFTLSGISSWGSYRYLEWLGRVTFVWNWVWIGEYGRIYGRNWESSYLFAGFGAPTELGGGGVLMWGVVSNFISFWLYRVGDFGEERRSEFSDLFYSYSIPILDIQKYKERIFEIFTTKLCDVLSFYFLFF